MERLAALARPGQYVGILSTYIASVKYTREQ